MSAVIQTKLLFYGIMTNGVQVIIPIKGKNFILLLKYLIERNNPENLGRIMK